MTEKKTLWSMVFSVLAFILALLLIKWGALAWLTLALWFFVASLRLAAVYKRLATVPEIVREQAEQYLAANEQERLRLIREQAHREGRGEMAAELKGDIQGLSDSLAQGSPSRRSYGIPFRFEDWRDDEPRGREKNSPPAWKFILAELARTPFSTIILAGWLLLALTILCI